MKYSAVFQDVYKRQKEYNLRILGRLPVDPRLAKSCDKGAIELYDGNWLDNATEIIEKL